MARCGWKKKDVACDFDAATIALPGEEWRPVVGWERVYRVSSLGRLYSLHQTGRLVVGMLVRGGYRVLKARDHDRRAHLMTHAMVLETFVGPRPEGHQGCHGAAGVSDNSLANLRWGTLESNQADRWLHGTANFRGPRALTAENVIAIRTSPSITDDEWATRLGVCIQSIIQARVGRTWSQVDTPPLRRREIANAEGVS